MIDKDLSEDLKQIKQLLKEIGQGIGLLVKLAEISQQQSFTRVDGEIYDK